MSPTHVLIMAALTLWCGLSRATESTSHHIATANFIKRLDPQIYSDNMTYYERRRIIIERILEDEQMSKIASDEAYFLGFLDRRPPLRNTFPCMNFSIPGSGTNINNLTPGDIKVVAALGDSLSAGLGIRARTIVGLLFEDKGRVFDIGGISDTQTLPNFLRVYNPNVKGFSMKKSFMKSSIDGMNIAESSATSQDLMSQVDTLISVMQSSKSIDFEKDWKLINIFIGNNDICRSCEKKNAASFTPELFKQRVLAALDKLKAKVPRAFVSLLLMLDVFEVHNLNQGIICSALHLFECPCVAFSKDIDSVIKVNDDFQNVLTEIGESDRYNNTDDFVVVTQPFFRDTNIPYVNGKPDLSYFAPDCFHLSEKGHGQVALSLWNSLFEPIQSKRQSWQVGETFECPSRDKPFLATTKNSS